MSKILIVDDRPVNRQVLKEILKYSHQIMEAGDGAEALELAQAGQPDLIIADILMPTMDGYELVRQLRADPSVSRIPVIFYTAYYHDREVHALARACNVAQILYKPVDPEKVLQAVEEALGQPVPPAVQPPNDEFSAEHMRLLTDKLAHKVEELDATNGRLTDLVQLGTQLASEKDPQRMLEAACRASREIVVARAAIIGILDQGLQGVRHLSVCGIDSLAAAPQDFLRLHRTTLAGLLAERRPLRLHGTPELTFNGLSVRSLLAVPIFSPERCCGWLILVNKTGLEEFSEENERLAVLIAAKVGIFYENKSYAIELRQRIEELQNEMMERKLVEEALRQAKEAAESASRAKDQFLANMSHELRTPLTGVLGMHDLVLSGNLEAEQREFIGMAQTSARSLLRIFNDILELTKIESGKLSLEEKPFLVRECMENTFNIFLPVAKSKGLDLNFTVAEDVPETMIGDRTRINQVLTNLAGNAVKFTEKGKVALRVAAGGSTPDGKREVTFTVADTGIGIPDDKKDLLFRVFSQVDDSHTREYGGTGLGLAISKRIVERMGGTITFTSEEGKGSTFSCTIPLGEAEPEREAIFASGETATAADHPSRAEEIRKPRLLVAEDDQVVRQVLGSMLQRFNYEADFAENGRKAVELWENGKYDLILMDVQMPLMNGFEATGAIREKERTRGGHIPIIAVTAHALKEDKARCRDAGMDAYISKPIDFKTCLQLIEEQLRITNQELESKCPQFS